MREMNTLKKADYIVIGAGIYGLYSAKLLGKRGYKVIVLERGGVFQRASYVNQARLHNGYHYPRSVSTAEKTASYFERFYSDYYDCILKDFEQIYAVSSNFSYTNAKQFVKFCKKLNIRCDEVSPNKYFKKNLCESAFITTEYTFDAVLIQNKLLSEIAKINNIIIEYNSSVSSIESVNKKYRVITSNEKIYEGNYIINTTYAAVNGIISLIKGEFFDLKYELCEVILCDVSSNLKNVGITVMDGPFFSVMPFGKTKMHSLTSVTFTPHKTSYSLMPIFDCQEKSKGSCTPNNPDNCNNCKFRPQSAWAYMSALVNKYMKDCYKISYRDSIYAIKPILNKSEYDDSRPTVIQTQPEYPTFLSVLSGKINTIYDLDEVLI